MLSFSKPVKVRGQAYQRRARLVRRARMLERPEIFWLPGLFLLLLGFGNALVGYFKADQFNEVLRELQSAEQFKEEVTDSSPLMRLQMAKLLSDKVFERRERFEERRNFYRTVEFGGKAVMALSLGLFSAGAFLAWWNDNPQRKL